MRASEIKTDERDQLAEALKALAISINRQNAPRESNLRLSFGGLEHENPAEFLEELELSFQRHQIRDEREKLYQAGSRLTGAAAAWYAPQKLYLRTFWEFADKLSKRYDGFDRLAELRVELLTRQQKEGESVETFILRKRALFHRLHPEGSDYEMVQLILNQLDFELKSRLRVANIADVDALIHLACKLEKDVREMRSKQKRPAPYQPTVPKYQPTVPRPAETRPPTTQEARPPRQAPQSVQNNRFIKSEQRPKLACFTCGGPHFMRDCPKKPVASQVAPKGQAPQPRSEGPKVAAAQPTVQKKKADANGTGQDF